MASGSELTLKQRGTAAAARLPRISAQTLTIALGCAWALAFVLVGSAFNLQMYGDGAVFSYAVALGESWAIHWHNIIGRISVYLLCMLPAECLARWMHSAAAGVALYGVLFFGAQATGLALTWRCDRSQRLVFFTTACLSTACLCPLVFGFPTEMWIAHALFWPTLTFAHQARAGRANFVVLLLAMLALIFTHEGAVVLASAIAATTLSHGAASTAFRRSCAALAITLALWILAHLAVPPDRYFAPVLARASRNFFDPQVFMSGAFARLATVVFGFAVLVLLLRRLGARWAIAIAAAIVIAATTIDWLAFSPPLHTDNRYLLRTGLVIATPLVALVPVLLTADNDAAWLARLTARLRRRFDTPFARRAALAAVMLVTLVHAVEAERFVSAWDRYTDEIRALASGPASDASLGDARFVSSQRVDRGLQALAWSSTTPYLSVLLAPSFNPARLVIDPAGGYFWQSCSLSRSNEAASGIPIPAPGRRLLRIYSCLHR